jgi:hypothetical protein
MFFWGMCELLHTQGRVITRRNRADFALCLARAVLDVLGLAVELRAVRRRGTFLIFEPISAPIRGLAGHDSGQRGARYWMSSGRPVCFLTG